MIADRGSDRVRLHTLDAVLYPASAFIHLARPDHFVDSGRSLNMCLSKFAAKSGPVPRLMIHSIGSGARQRGQSVNLYRTMAAGLMELYEQWFSDDTFHPATYAATVITLALSFLALGAFGTANRVGFDTQFFHTAPKWVLFLVGAGVYTVQAVYLFAGERWKISLAKFRALNRRRRISVYILDALFFFGALSWLLADLSL